MIINFKSIRYRSAQIISAGIGYIRSWTAGPEVPPPTPGERIFSIAADVRTLAVANDIQTWPIASESRVLAVANDIRTWPIASESRVLAVTL